MSRHALLKTSRLLHLYLGVFITPALIFFAFTGAIQTFGLHETNRDHPTYVPAKWLVVLGQIHKKQTPIIPVRRPPAAAVLVAPGGSERSDRHSKSEDPATPSSSDSAKSAAVPQPPPQPTKKPRPLPLRIFFLLVSIGLLTSTMTGLYMSYKFIRNKTLITFTLIAGIVIPIILTLL